MSEIMSNDKAMAVIGKHLNDSIPFLVPLLPSGNDADANRIIKMASLQVRMSENLMRCDPKSIVRTVLLCAQHGLEPDGIGCEAYLVPFSGECKLIVGYRGLMKLARNSTDIAYIQARAVYRGDAFDCSFGIKDELYHRPCGNSDDGDLTHAWAKCVYKTGEVQYDVMTRGEIDKVRASSKSKDRGPWVTNYSQMAVKTVIRRLCKQLPFNPKLRDVLAMEDATEMGIPQSRVIESVVVPDEPEPTKKSDIENLKSKMKAETVPPAPVEQERVPVEQEHEPSTIEPPTGDAETQEPKEDDITPKQKSFLNKRKVDMSGMNKFDASKVIDHIQANGWKTPTKDEIDAMLGRNEQRELSESDDDAWEHV